MVTVKNMELTGKCKKDFNNYKPWYYFLMTNNHKRLIMYGWFNCLTGFKIDIHSSLNCYDWFIIHPFLDKVYTSDRDVNINPYNAFSPCLKDALKKANEIYNNGNS